MKKRKIGLLTLLALGISSVFAVGAFSFKSSPRIALADPDESETESEIESTENSEETSEEETSEEIHPCTVLIEAAQHGKIAVSKEWGEIGEIVEITATHDLLYLVENVSVNGVALIEDEQISGLYKFALVEGENRIAAKFVVDAELLGELSVIYDQAMNKDWTNLFSLDNLLRIISWLLSGGVLIAVIRFVIHDKKVAKQTEEAVKKSVEKAIPEATRASVLAIIEEALKPYEENMKQYFIQIMANNEELMKAMSVFAKCMALGQENTPEAKRAILDELSGLKLGDFNTIEGVKQYITDLMAQQEARLQEMLAKIDHISTSNKEIAEVETAKEEIKEEPKEEPEEIIEDNGTQI